MFQLHERLAADTYLMASWELCDVLLLKNAVYPWFVLVPRQSDLVEIIDLSVAHQTQLMREIAKISAFLREDYQIDKINVGALGNMVPQLHVHVLGRTKNDPAWPGPVWGHPESREYSESEVSEIQAKIQAL